MEKTLKATTSWPMVIAMLWASNMSHAGAEESPVVRKFIGTGPRVICNAPLSKYRVVYQRDGKLAASTICIEKERVTTERGLSEITLHLVSERSADPVPVVVVNVTPLTE